MANRLALDKSVYSLEAVQKAAYRFIHLTILISQEDKIIYCDIEPLAELSKPYEQVLADFKQESAESATTTSNPGRDGTGS